MARRTVSNTALVEDFPRLTIADLRAAGVLACAVGRASPSRLAEVSLGPAWKVRVHADSDPAILTMETKHGSKTFRRASGGYD